jgi:peptide-methionine (S)-S-oxide reductase
MIMKTGLIAISVAAVAVAFGITVAQNGQVTPKPKQEVQEKPMEGTETLVVAGGCFWCVEAIYEELRGVVKVESGYTGGQTVNPSYEQVCTGATGHAEAVKITFDPKVITEDDLLHIFFTTHDPTTLNRQGPDEGTQYRSAVFFKDEAEKALAVKVIKDIEHAKIWRDPIVTTLEPLQTFYPAEDYHQDYFDKYEKSSNLERLNMNSGYCRAIIEPKVRKFRAKYADKLKK